MSERYHVLIWEERKIGGPGWVRVEGASAYDTMAQAMRAIRVQGTSRNRYAVEQVITILHAVE